MRYEARMASIELRPVTAEDVERLYVFQSDPKANEMAAFPARDVEAHWAHWTKILADETVTARAITIDGELAGNVGSWSSEDKRLVGYWIGRDFWGLGIATTALRRFTKIETHRPLYAHVALANKGSIRVLEKCGFETADERPEPGDDGVEEMLMVLRGR